MMNSTIEPIDAVRTTAAISQPVEIFIIKNRKIITANPTIIRAIFPLFTFDAATLLLVGNLR